MVYPHISCDDPDGTGLNPRRDRIVDQSELFSVQALLSPVSVVCALKDIKIMMYEVHSKSS